MRRSKRMLDDSIRIFATTLRERLKFGNVMQIKEEAREVWSVVWIEQLLQDIRFGLRMLRRSPGFTAVAVITLALGINANTAIFSVVYAVLLKPLPHAKADQLFNLFEARPQEGITGTGWSYANFTELRQQNHVFSEMAGSQHHQLTLTGRSEPSVVNASVVTPELFSLFGEKPLAGRMFVSEDGKPGAMPVVMLSEGSMAEDVWSRSKNNRKLDRLGQAFLYRRWNHSRDVSVPSCYRKRATLDPSG